MKYLTNKKLWAAIIGLITAFGTVMVTLDEAKADAGTPGFTPATFYGGSVGKLQVKTEFGDYNGTDAVRFAWNWTSTATTGKISVYVLPRSNWLLGTNATSALPGTNNTTTLYKTAGPGYIPLWYGTFNTNVAVHKLDTRSTTDDIYKLLEDYDCEVMFRMYDSSGNFIRSATLYHVQAP